MGDFKTGMQCGKCEQEYERLKMEDKLDFKGLSKDFDNFCVGAVPNTEGTEQLYSLTVKEGKTIQTALRLASRLQSGEVGDEALNIFHNISRIRVIPQIQESNILNDVEMIKAMATQMIAEEVGK